MRITEPSAVLLETGDECVFTPAGGSALPPTLGLLEDAITERQTGNTTREAAAWQLTCATSAVANLGEGDGVEINGEAFEILDRVAFDSSFTVFLITNDL